ncbi:MAG: hypothetical protein OEN52_11815 [Gammaproteobacteria bacterium]|nr:hypothetical protein [Gammaproteobacteria bacterium]MDH3561627.1 hypothetical protein [Gammaproteobacteria bacterium]
MDKAPATGSLHGIPRLRRLQLWSHRNRRRGPRYVTISVIALACVWLPAIAYLMLATPSYTSKWTLILPGKGAGSSINLADIGQASTIAASPYGSPSISPQVNYKELVSSDGVILAAAEKLDMTAKEFGKPRIKLVDQTSLIYLSMTGSEPDIARAKARALNETLLELLERLRTDEIQQRETGFDNMLQGFRIKLDQARNALLKHQSQSDIVASGQFEQLTLSIEQLYLERARVKADLEEMRGQVQRLAANLGLTAQQAGDALILQNDRLFQNSLDEYSESRLLLNSYANKWGDKHPEVHKEKSRLAATRRTMQQRIDALIQGRNDELIELLQLEGDTTRNALFENLINLDARRMGLEEKFNELLRLITEMQKKLNDLTGNAAILDDLKRDHQVAEAVFSSALARVDTGKSDIYVSYPLVQLLDLPTLPEKPTSPNTLLVIAGALTGSLFVLTGLVLMWIRKPLLHKILKNA